MADLVKKHYEDLQWVHCGGVPEKPERTEIDGESTEEGELPLSLSLHDSFYGLRRPSVSLRSSQASSKS
jgi:hypothetical protein